MRRFIALATMFAGFSLAGCGGSSGSPPVPPAAGAFAVATGASDASAAFEVLRSYPRNVVIDGDTLTWTIASGSPHVIALLPSGQKTPAAPANTKPAGGMVFDGSAFVSSGLIGKGATYSLTFLTPGTYTVLCLVHQPEMKQTITVRAAGTTRPATAAQLAAATQAESSADLDAATGTLAAFPFAAGGTHLAAGLSPKTTPPSPFSIYRFLDGPSLDAGITIPLGTTLTWTNVSHNVTFPVPGQRIPATFNDFGPPLGTADYDGSTLTTSSRPFTDETFS